jgi:hypothetical protein
VGGSLITRGESTTDLNTKLIIFLGSLGSYNGEARVKLTGYSRVILLERHIIQYIVFKTLSLLKRFMVLDRNENILG